MRNASPRNLSASSITPEPRPFRGFAMSAMPTTHVVIHDNTWQVRLIFERELSAASQKKARALPTSDKVEITANYLVTDPKCVPSLPDAMQRAPAGLNFLGFK